MTPKSSHRFNVSPEVNLLAEKVIGAAIEVHRMLGPGYLESVYEAALRVELALRGLAFEKQLELDLNYKGVLVGQGRIDLLVEKKLIVELKAIEALLPIRQAQVISYLKLTGCELGLLINFNSVLLKNGIMRVVHPSLIS
jgi:GxxExxY protein